MSCRAARTFSRLLRRCCSLGMDEGGAVTLDRRTSAIHMDHFHFGPFLQELKQIGRIACRLNFLQKRRADSCRNAGRSAVDCKRRPRRPVPAQAAATACAAASASGKNPSGGGLSASAFAIASASAYRPMRAQ